MKFYLPFFILFISANLFSQNFWQRIDEKALAITRDIEREVTPLKYSSNYLDLNGLKKYLKKAPFQFNKKNKSIPLYIPMPEGNYMLFDIVKSPVMEQGLAEKYPDISSYKGFSRDNPEINIRFNIGPKGFFGSIYWKKHNIYIDPLGKGLRDYSMSYYTSDYKVDISNINLTCGVEDSEILNEENLLSTEYNGQELELREASVCDSVKQYNYRLALACTGEWGQKHGGTVEKALADMVTAVNRINQIYENEFAIHFNLVSNNDQIIWLDPDTDPFDNPTLGTGLLQEVSDAINNKIKPNNFDIGHIFTNRCTDVGGVANLSGVCTGIKARGVTCQYTDDLNYIVTNVTCHEMGHQFSATHTFNNCNGNESLSTGFEPGGGTTIMAYCGLCGPNNVDYQCLETFHSNSVEMIKRFSRELAGSGCAEKISTDNTAPIVELNYEDGFYIPVNTPFYLEGTGFDCEGDELLYSWEEMDTGPQTPIGQPVDNSPLFTAREPSESPVRYFPKLYNLLYNIYQNYNSEILPSYSRDLNFRLIARDNHPGGGGTGWADVHFKADGSAGPFIITYPELPVNTIVGDSVMIKWNVANTDNDKVNCKKVNILFSVDRGFTYPYILKYQTPNDGSELVYIPDTITSNGRIKVEAADNIFFAVSKYSVNSSEPEDSTFRIFVDDVSGQLCLPADLEYNLSTRAYNGYEDSIRFEISRLPENAAYTIDPPVVVAGENASLVFDLDSVIDGGHFEPVIAAISNGGDTIYTGISWDLYTNRYKELPVLNPIPGSEGNHLNTEFKWKKPKATDYVNIYISKNPAFPVNETIVKTEITDSFFLPENTLDYSSLYYWKLEFANNCGITSPDTIYTFSTIALDCKDYASDDVPVIIKSKKTVSASIEIENDLTITDLNVSLKGFHQYFKEISASLLSPDSTKILLFNYKPFNYNGNFNLTFDDEASSKIKSPPNGTYIPAEPLSVFNGKNAKGIWSLEITDNKTSQSGQLLSFVLNICSNVILNKPEIVNNNLFKIPLNAAWAITPDNLKVKDVNNTDDELIFTIVKVPEKSAIYKNNTILYIGDTFTQDDINNGIIKLKYTGSEVIRDKFYFTVIDGEGGWVDITPFYFEVDPTIDGVKETFFKYVNIYPNPANNYLNINIGKEGNYHLSLLNLEGKRIFSDIISGNYDKTIDLSGFSSGLYFINIYNEKYTYSGKVIKQN
ncbi:MAG TPA: T9SS type A sorting domain-containing protein [Bacteroidetes bacterium]|nr:T9SS type A sorting domain-containing protein [Bacteroidota bacterium]